MALILFVMNLFFSSLAVWLFLRWVKKPFGKERVIAVSTVGAFFAVAFSLAFALQLAVTFVLCILAYPFKSDGKVTRLAVILPPVISYCIILAMIVPRLREFSALRREFPIISLDARLKKIELVPASTSMNSRPDQELAWAVQRRFSDDDRLHIGSIRSVMLRDLHRYTADDFTLAQGFGQVRMMMPRRERIALPKLGPIPFESSPAERGSGFHPNGSALEGIAEPIATPEVPSRDNLVDMHTSGLLDFVSRDAAGYVIDRDHVSGFESHRFYVMPGTDLHPSDIKHRDLGIPIPPARRELWRRNWAIVRIELIGLLSHPEPVAYISNHLPQLDELDRYPVRKLDEFETGALVAMRTQEDVVIIDQPRVIRMLGSLRAGKGCQDCHKVPRGELLGALSYELRPE